jgi:hypothetical protein
MAISDSLEVTAIRVEERTIRLGFRFGLEIRWSTKGGNVGWGADFRTSGVEESPQQRLFLSFELNVENRNVEVEFLTGNVLT